MDAWDSEARPVKPGYPPHDVQRYCVRDEQWQILRLAMKGKPTTAKLDMLAKWYDRFRKDWAYRTEVQVGNYLGALRRGGQLDMQNRVQR